MSDENKKPVSITRKKVFSSFKSPCQPVNGSTKLKVTPRNVSPLAYNGTPRPIIKNRKRVLATSFVSPLKTKITKTGVTDESVLSLEKEIEKQESEIKELEKEGLSANDLSLYIDKLHKYNEIKDVGQMLLGRLALQQETTTSNLYSEFGLSNED